MSLCGVFLTDRLLVEHKAADHAPDAGEAPPPQHQLEGLWKQKQNRPLEESRKDQGGN